MEQNEYNLDDLKHAFLEGWDRRRLYPSMNIEILTSHRQWRKYKVVHLNYPEEKSNEHKS